MKKKIFKTVYLSLISCCLLINLRALEIPIQSRDSFSSEGKSREFRIAYADMELIYNVCPQRTRASSEYRALKEKFEVDISSLTSALDKRKQDLSLIEKEISELRLISSATSPSASDSQSTQTDMSVSTGDITSSSPIDNQERKSAPSLVTSTAQIKGVEAIYEKEIARKALLAEIDKLSAELNTVRDTMNKELSAKEKQCATDVLEELYKVLQKIATEEELILIIDKNYILYAPDVYDITHKVIERLK